jgi:hypothetical protein
MEVSLDDEYDIYQLFLADTEQVQTGIRRDAGKEY